MSWIEDNPWCGYYCNPVTERWVFAGDMNRDGAITISDLAGIFSYGFYAPGDAITYFILTKMPEFAAFMEMSSHSAYGGWFCGIFSLFVWWMIGTSIAAIDAK